MSRPAAGALRHRLVLEEPVDNPDGAGGFSRRYVARFSRWGMIQPVTDAMRHLAGRDETSFTHLIHVRAPANWRAGWRFRKGDRVFTILSLAADDAASGYLRCRCREIAP